MKNAIVIGGTSGIGRRLAELLSENHWKVAVTGRRTELLDEISTDSNRKIITLEHDLTELEVSDDKLNSLFKSLGKVDLIIVSAGISELNQDLKWEVEKQVIEVNVNGIAKVYQHAFSKLKQQKHGHLVGISSIASLRGNRYCPSYSAAKAFQANYLEALRCISKNEKLQVIVTDVQPGFVDTAMAKGEGLFWVAPVDKAAKQILKGIKRKKRKIYVSKRWRLIAYVMKLAPNWVVEKL